MVYLALHTFLLEMQWYTGGTGRGKNKNYLGLEQLTLWRGEASQAGCDWELDVE